MIGERPDGRLVERATRIHDVLARWWTAIFGARQRPVPGPGSSPPLLPLGMFPPDPPRDRVAVAMRGRLDRMLRRIEEAAGLSLAVTLSGGRERVEDIHRQGLEVGDFLDETHVITRDQVLRECSAWLGRANGVVSVVEGVSAALKILVLLLNVALICGIFYVVALSGLLHQYIPALDTFFNDASLAPRFLRIFSRALLVGLISAMLYGAVTVLLSPIRRGVISALVAALLALPVALGASLWNTVAAEQALAEQRAAVGGEVTPQGTAPVPQDSSPLAKVQSDLADALKKLKAIEEDRAKDDKAKARKDRDEARTIAGNIGKAEAALRAIGSFFDDNMAKDERTLYVFVFMAVFFLPEVPRVLSKISSFFGAR